MLSLYVHIPFCMQKCNYCDFVSFPAAQGLQEEYVKALIKEIKLYSRSDNYRLASLYFGGGTPTLLSEKMFIEIFTVISDSFIIPNNTEITVEANPGTLSKDKAKLLKELGVNRISLGVQSMHNDELLAMGRIHSAKDVYKVVETLAVVGINNYSFDFIGGLPDQNKEKLISSLRHGVDLSPKHISLYGLKLEEGTPWEKFDRENKLTFPDEDLSADLMKAGQQFLNSMGYKRYEISNYSLEGFTSRHNMQYWLNEPFLGVGLGASSYLDGERYTNECDIKQYIINLQQEVLPIAQREKINLKIEQAETLFLGLRLIEGIEIARFNRRFDSDLFKNFSHAIEKHVGLGLLNITPTHLRLTPRGLDVANEVMIDFIP